MNNSSDRTCLTIILAAGEGTRMRSDMSKVLHPVAGLPMVNHVMEAASEAGGSALAVVVGNQAERVAEAVTSRNGEAQIFVQTERLGTGHAVLAAREAIDKSYDDILILYGDVPLTRPETLLELRGLLADGVDVAVLGFRTDSPTGYGRLLEKDGELVAIREHKDASEYERQVKFCNGGIMAFSGKEALSLLDGISNDNVKQEYYLTDIVEVACSRNLKVVAIEADEAEIIGVNNRVELAQVEALWQQRKRETLMLSSVAMSAPETVFFHFDTQVEGDVTIEPNVVFGPEVIIKSGANIRAFSHLEGANVGNDVVVGPYARLRPGAELLAGSKVGNFCEIKKAVIEEGAKVNHLSYVGDARVGAGANIGAGTITCNYDGMNKHFTDIGKNAFIGSNSSLVAPVKIGDGGFVASGSVITEDVPDDAMGIGRGRQTVKEKYGTKIRERNAALKESRRK
ncbi:MAG: bifunctional UDP-N-acetylglucosamine diphosphorylase/glucosamine-1-phosphate N-acetyltransferase GlmU [Rhizobiaceae bacterium]